MAPQQRTQTQTRQAPQERAFDPNARRPEQPISKPENAKAENGHGHVEKETIYVPFGEKAEVKLTLNMVRALLCQPTKQGQWPSDAEVGRFIMVCKHRQLNPWVGDCWLLGYDTYKDRVLGPPKFSIVVAVQALMKRAELNPNFDGIESGIVVDRNGEIVERPGDLIVNGETLLGGWAIVHRKDKTKPFYQRLSIAPYDKGTPQWKSDPCGMISKCSEAAALRQAFPSDIGGIYLEQELHSDQETLPEAKTEPKLASARNELANRLAQQPSPERVVGKAPAQQSPPDQPQTRQEASGEHDQTADAPAEDTGAEAQDAAPEGQEGTQENPEAAGAGGEGEAQGAAAQGGLKF